MFKVEKGWEEMDPISERGGAGLVARLLFGVGLLAALLSLAACGSSSSSSSSSSSTSGETTASSGGGSGDPGPGITDEKPLPPFKASDKVGEVPDLPKVLAFAAASSIEFEQQLTGGLEKGAADGGLEFKTANSEGDPQKQVQNMEQFLIQGVGSLVTLPVEPEAQTPAMLRAIGEGVDMSAVVFGPATIQANAPQYAGGQKLAEAAAEFIETELGGKANVVILSEDANEPIRPRFEGMRDVFAGMPGVKIVADVEPEVSDTQHGFQTMTTILQKEPDVDVVLGSDPTVEGALAALEAAHKASPEQFLGGVNCENQALAYIEEGGPYKACVGTAPSVFGYALGRYAGDWLEGKCIPQAISVNATAVTGPQEAAAYKADEQDPAGVFEDPKRLSEYLSQYGNICYETHDQYLAYSWVPPGATKAE